MIAFVERIYRLLVRLFPPSFRRRYGEEMVSVFRSYCLDAYQQRGITGLLDTLLFSTIDVLFNLAAEYLSIGSRMLKELDTMLRRSLDICVAVMGLCVSIPFLPAIAVAIKLDSRGPVFYVSQRVGKNGVTFAMYKLRSMEHEPRSGTRRVTRVGHILRWLRLDEMPQMVNLLHGEMTLFGPRPWIAEQFNPRDERQFQRAAVKPGLLS